MAESFIKRANSEEELERETAKQIEDLQKTVEAAKQKRKADFIMPQREKINGDSNMFLLLIELNDADVENNEDSHTWTICEDRQEAYDFIKANIESINLVDSKIVSETVSFVEAVSMAAFMTHVLDSGKIEDPGFDPRDYIPDYWDIDNE